MKFNKYTGKFCPEDSDFEGMSPVAAVVVTSIFAVIAIVGIVVILCK